MVMGFTMIAIFLCIKAQSFWPAVLLHASHNVFVQSIFDENDERCKRTLPSAEDEYLEQVERSEYEERLQNEIDRVLTSVQKRRLYMKYFRNMSAVEIAKIEGSSFSAVSKSIRLAKEKIKKISIIF